VDRGLRVIDGSSAVPIELPTDSVRFRLECVDAFGTSWVMRGFSPVTITNDTGVLERMLTALGKPVWDATPDDVDRVVGAMAAEGLAASTRRGYVQVLKGFHRFLMARRAVEIEAASGCGCRVRWMSSTPPGRPHPTGQPPLWGPLPFRTDLVGWFRRRGNGGMLMVRSRAAGTAASRLAGSRVLAASPREARSFGRGKI
jgi:hypothetical protein